MKVAVFGTKPYDRQFLEAVNESAQHELTFFKVNLNESTVGLIDDYSAVCVFVNDVLNEEVIASLAERGVRAIALRCSGFNNVDLEAAKRHDLRVVSVPAYSPNAIAEHAVALLLTLNRRTHRAYNRVREGNFSLQGLLGYDIAGRTVGVIGTGEIGAVFARIMRGFGCEILAFDPKENPKVIELGARYVELPELFCSSDIISLHCPLIPATKHLLNSDAFARMKDGVTVINTSRGAVIETRAAIDALKSGRLGGLALDVYEGESGLFFDDHSEHFIADDVFSRLTTFPNVLITGHQAFFTQEALTTIARTTLENLTMLEQEIDCPNLVSA